MRERRRREWLIPFARSLTRQAARKAPPHKGCSKIGRDRAGRSSVFQRKMRPRSGLLAPHVYFGALWHPRRCPIPAFAGPLGPRSGEPPRCAPWHRSPGYDLRRAPYDHPDFTSNALSEDLFSASLSILAVWHHECMATYRAAEVRLVCLCMCRGRKEQVWYGRVRRDVL